MDLREIKKHPHFPFRDFESNDLEFLLLELYWAELFRSFAQEKGNPGRETDWVPVFPAARDGNPILHLVNRTRSVPRFLRIVQRFNTERLPEVSLESNDPVAFSTDAYVPFVPGLTVGAVDPHDLSPAEELLIASDVSDACEKLLRRFVDMWCFRYVAASEMGESIAAFWADIDARLVQRQP